MPARGSRTPTSTSPSRPNAGSIPNSGSEGAECTSRSTRTRYADLQRGDPAVVHTLQHAAAIYVPLIVLGELRAGFLGGNRAGANEQILTAFLARPGVRVLTPDDRTTHHYARLFQQLRQNATPIPTNDLWIAALVVQHGLTLYSRDAHFDRIPQLARV